MNYAISTPWPLPPPFLCPRLFCGSRGLWNGSVPGPSRSIFICLPWAVIDLWVTSPCVEAGSVSRNEQKTASHLAWLGLLTGQCKKKHSVCVQKCRYSDWPSMMSMVGQRALHVIDYVKRTKANSSKKSALSRDIWQHQVPMRGGKERIRGRG